MPPEIIDLLSSSSPSSTASSLRPSRDGARGIRRAPSHESLSDCDLIDLSRDSQNAFEILHAEANARRQVDEDRTRSAQSRSSSEELFVRQEDDATHTPSAKRRRLEAESPISQRQGQRREIHRSGCDDENAWRKQPWSFSPSPVVPEAGHPPPPSELRTKGRAVEGSGSPFGSSPPRPTYRDKGKSKAEVIVLDDSQSTAPREASPAACSASSDDDLDLGKLRDAVKSVTARALASTSRGKASNSSSIAPKATQPEASPKRTVEGKDDRRQRRAATKASKDVDKAQKALEKEEAKRKRAEEKAKAAALAEVDKIRTDKKTSTPEMIVDIPGSLPAALIVQMEALLKELDVETHTWTSPVPNVIRWRRKVSSAYNDDLGHWEPVPMRIEAVDHVLVVMSAAEFVDLVLGANGVDIDTHVSIMQASFTGCKLMYLIEGLNAWKRHNRTIRNRQFASAVRSWSDAGNGNTDASGASAAGASAVAKSSSNRGRPGAPQQQRNPKEYISPDTIEDALLRLQVRHSCLIHETVFPLETARWTTAFTQHLSTVPYRRQQERERAAAGFCMDYRSGGGGGYGGDGTPRDTFARMLAEMPRVTAPIAWGIVEEYGSVRELVQALQKDGDVRLAACRRSLGKGVGEASTRSDRTVGPAIARRIARVFTERDETTTDV